MTWVLLRVYDLSLGLRNSNMEMRNVDFVQAYSPSSHIIQPSITSLFSAESTAALSQNSESYIFSP